MIDQLKENFSFPEKKTCDPPAKCQKCGAEHFWRREEKETWKCFRCERLPAEIKFYEMASGKIRKQFGERGDVTQSSKQSPGSDRAKSSLTAEAPAGTKEDLGQVAVLVETLTLNATEPVCEHCGCRWYDEMLFSDGSVVMRCWTCQMPTDGKIKIERRSKRVSASRVGRQKQQV